MGNEQYLILSYFTVPVITAVAGLIVWKRLQAPMERLRLELGDSPLFRVIRKMFPACVILPALAAVLGVNFRGCNRERYEQIIADRPYLVSKTREQLSEAFGSMADSLLVLGFVVLGVLIALHRNRPGKDS